jgi:hypothetical protein
MWEQILPAWDAAHHAGLAATHPQRSTLAAVLWLLARYQRTTDTVRLTQVAHHAGMWNGEGECPRHITAAVGRHLQALHELGAITYEPSTSRRGVTITLPPGSRAADARAEEGDSRAPDARANGGSRAHGARASSSARALSAPARALSGTETPSARALSAPARASRARASEDLPEEVLRGSSEEGAGRRTSASSGAPHDTEVVVVPAGVWLEPGEGDAELISWCTEVSTSSSTVYLATEPDGTTLAFTVAGDGLHFIEHGTLELPPG